MMGGLETILLAACLIVDPGTCRGVEVYVTPENGASLQNPFHCWRHAQLEAAKWVESHPDWRVTHLSCPRGNRSS
jgi:hypothetical protein